MQEFSFQVFEAYGAATVAYCLVNLTVTMLARALERRVAIPGYARGVMGLDLEVIGRTLPFTIGTGMVFTLLLTLLAGVGGLLLGTVVAVLRMSGNRVLEALMTGYVDLVRSLPLVLVIFWFYFLVPWVAQWVTGSRRPVQIGAVQLRADHVRGVRGGVFQRDRAGGDERDPARAVDGGDGDRAAALAGVALRGFCRRCSGRCCR